MKIEFTGRQTDVPADARRLAERKLSKLARLLPAVTRAHVILTAEKHRQVAEVSLRLPADRPRGHGGDERRCASRSPRRSGSSSGRPRSSGRSGRCARAPTRRGPPRRRREKTDGPGPRVIRTRRTAVKPMTLDEAALELGGRGDGVLVFRDASTERVNVLYRRADGNLGLIEPEA